jgi:hypothetical protein
VKVNEEEIIAKYRRLSQQERELILASLIIPRPAAHKIKRLLDGIGGLPQALKGDKKPFNRR